MALPPKIDEKIQSRFTELITESEHLLQKMLVEEADAERRNQSSSFVWMGTFSVSYEAFYSFRTRFLSLLNYLSDDNEHLNSIATDIKNLDSTVYSMKKLRGYLHGLSDDYKNGMFETLSEVIEANVVGDYLGQAENLLKEGQLGKYDHVPAAVLTGAILEDSLRRICQRQNPPIPVDKSNGEPKTLNPIIDDLKKADVFNELKAKQLRSWADIRNAAAHGKFDDFTRQDVEQMLTGVQNFLADYM